MVTQHTPRLHTPFYAEPEDGTVLHRYLDEQFVPRFLHDANSGQLNGTQAQPWRSEDRFGRFAEQAPTLRLPLHRTFHVACCELSCDMPGDPAWDPTKVLSAGMVIRRLGRDETQAWQVSQSVAQGWQDIDSNEQRDPDQFHRLLQRGLLTEADRTALFSGEQTHPMHAQVVTQDLGNGQQRTRTLLYGFVPLGGHTEVSLNAQAVNDGELTIDGLLADQHWPFGCSNNGATVSPGNAYCGEAQALANCCGRFGDWQQNDGWQVRNGTPQAAMFKLLRTLIERYQINDSSNDANLPLRALLGEIYQRNNLSIDVSSESEPDLSGRHGRSLRHWLDNNTDYFIDEVADWETDNRNQGSEQPLPRLFGSSDVYITEEQAQVLRELLVMRAEQAQEQLIDSLPVPRFAQGEHDRYVILPFVRYRAACGNEKMVWGPASESFRVCSPLDPEAARPTSIQLPELDDVKRGLAKGVTFVTPKSLAEQIQKIKPDLEFKEQSGGLLGACASMTISFSIPIITICAMILLMIIIQLLNIFLRWLPWAILKLPILCRR